MVTMRDDIDNIDTRTPDDPFTDPVAYLAAYGIDAILVTTIEATLPEAA